MRTFVVKVSSGQCVDSSAIRVADVVDHVSDLTRRYRPATVELAASALRSFFRFLRVEGLRSDRLEDAATSSLPSSTSCNYAQFQQRAATVNPSHTNTITHAESTTCT